MVSLSNLLRKGTKFVWGRMEQDSFYALNCLKSIPILPDLLWWRLTLGSRGCLTAGLCTLWHLVPLCLLLLHVKSSEKALQSLGQGASGSKGGLWDMVASLGVGEVPRWTDHLEHLQIVQKLSQIQWSLFFAWFNVKVTYILSGCKQ